MTISAFHDNGQSHDGGDHIVSHISGMTVSAVRAYGMIIALSKVVLRVSPRSFFASRFKMQNLNPAVSLLSSRPPRDLCASVLHNNGNGGV